MAYNPNANPNMAARPSQLAPASMELDMRPDFSDGATPAMQGSMGMNVASLTNDRVASAIASIQAQVFMAKSFPRNREAALNHIEAECRRITLADKAAYRYQRGGTDIHGASINLLRAISQCWGNMESGIKVLERVNGTGGRPGYSKIQAYAIDFETNVRKVREFTVSHTTQKGRPLTEDRDIYECEANAGSRRERACLEAIIPTDVVDWALDLCTQTSVAYYKDHMDINAMVNSFRSEFGVTQAQLEAFAGRKITAIDTTIYVRLREIYKALKDGVAIVDDFFKPVEAESAVKPAREETEPKKVAAPKRTAATNVKEPAQPMPEPAAPTPQPVPQEPPMPADADYGYTPDTGSYDDLDDEGDYTDF